MFIHRNVIIVVFFFILFRQGSLWNKLVICKWDPSQCRQLEVIGFLGHQLVLFFFLNKKFKVGLEILPLKSILLGIFKRKWPVLMVYVRIYLPWMESIITLMDLSILWASITRAVPSLCYSHHLKKFDFLHDLKRLEEIDHEKF